MSKKFQNITYHLLHTMDENKKDKLPSYFFNFSIMVIFVGQ